MTLLRSGVAAVLVTVAASAAVALPATAAKSPRKPKTYKVGVQNDFYDPAKLTLHAGDKVKWSWHATGFELHDVYVDTGPSDFHSPTQAAGKFSYTFKKRGTYKLYCTQHEEDMTMTVTVKK